VSTRLLLATSNGKKLAELQRILDAALGGHAVELVGLADVPQYPPVPEVGLTFGENALLKAREGVRHTGLPTVADDSGLAVDAMNGMPGVFSARWAGRHGDDRANLELLLAQLADVPDEHRGAAFVCAAALVLPGGVANGDKLRMSEDAVRFVRAFFDAGKPVGVICHGGWILTDADVLKGRTITSYPSLKTDLRNAGATWVDEEVVVDNGLVSSRTPKDLPAFNAKLVEEIAEGRHEQQTA